MYHGDSTEEKQHALKGSSGISSIPLAGATPLARDGLRVVSDRLGNASSWGLPQVSEQRPDAKRRRGKKSEGGTVCMASRQSRRPEIRKGRTTRRR